jgi:hypothetical protein
MKKITAVILMFSFLMFNLGYVMPSHAEEPVTQNIASVAKAQEIATAAGGTYVEGATAPALTGTQVALPVIDSATGNVLGYIVADQASLVAALNAAGYASVASAVAAATVGTSAGLAVGPESCRNSSSRSRNCGRVALIAVSGGGGGGGGGGTTTAPLKDFFIKLSIKRVVIIITC